MKPPGPFAYRQAFLIFIAILLIFFAIVVVVIIDHERDMFDDAHKSALHELELIGNFTRDAILRDDFAAIEDFILHWGKEHPEVIEFKAVTPNNFVLVHFKRRIQPDQSFPFSFKVEHNQRELLTLEMVKDLSSVEESLNKFIAGLIWGSVFLIVILGSTLWYTLKRYALLPLEREVAIRREAEKKFRMLLESAPDAMVFVDREGRIVLVNKQTEKLFGYSQGELEGKEIEVFIPERFREKHLKQRASYVLNPVARPIGAGLDLYGVTRDGKEFPVDISLSPIETSEGLFVMADIRDISERKRSEEEIKRGYYFQTAISSILQISLDPLPLEKQLDRILDTILSLPFLAVQSMGCIYLVGDEPDVLVMKVQRGLPESIQSACAKVSFGRCLCGMSAATREIIFEDSTLELKEFDDLSPHGHYCVPIMSGDDVLGVMNLYVEKGHRHLQEEEELLMSVAKTLAGIIKRRKAEQEREKLREQLIQAEKLSALGRLTANVAHEIRNPLTSIGGYARRFEKKLPAASKEREYAGTIISEVARLEKILRSVLTFSRGAELNLRLEDINTIIEESLISFDLLCRERLISIEKSLSNVPPVMVDRGRIREVIQNLLSNAIDSMPKGGTLTVTAKEEVIHERPFLSVTITDTGEGIPEDKLRMIFEPFFSTKVLTQGTGLGLAICKKIIEDHGGSIGVESRAGKGSAFSFSLPLRKEPSVT
jgi:PAS domain S-box-containing protein